MPALPKEFNASLHHQGHMIYGGHLPINPDQQSNVARAFERYKEALEAAVSSPATAANMPAPNTRQQRTSPTPTPAPSRNRTSLTQRITETLTGTPAGMTPAQIARRLSSQLPTVQRILTQQVTTGAYVKEANKYRMSTTAPAQTAPAAAAPATGARTRTRSSARPRARSGGSGETSTDRVANLVVQRPGITKAEVITAMAPARPNHVGIWLSRLCKANRITGTQGGTEGPYYPTATSQRQAAAA